MQSLLHVFCVSVEFLNISHVFSTWHLCRIVKFDSDRNWQLCKLIIIQYTIFSSKPVWSLKKLVRNLSGVAYYLTFTTIYQVRVIFIFLQRFVLKWFACIYRYQFILFFFFKFANRAVALLITYLGGGITLYILLGNVYLYKMRSALQAEFNISKHAKCADVCNSLDVITRFILILNFGEARIERVKRKKFIICY